MTATQPALLPPRMREGAKEWKTDEVMEWKWTDFNEMRERKWIG